MSDRPITYKRRESRNFTGDSHSLTFSTFHRRKYLLDDRIYHFLAKRINEAAKAHNFAVLAYVFMHNHVHLLLLPLNANYDMSKILKLIKQGRSCSAKNRRWASTDIWEKGGGMTATLQELRRD